jgi:hypothetical protein
MFLQVNVLVDDSAAPLPRRPIFGRLAGYRLKSGRCASSAATSDFRTLGRISAEIRTLRLVGVETGPWDIRAGPEAEQNLRRRPDKGSPPHP